MTITMQSVAMWTATYQIRGTVGAATVLFRVQATDRCAAKNAARAAVPGIVVDQVTIWQTES